jgi:hypothetical protein
VVESNTEMHLRQRLRIRISIATLQQLDPCNDIFISATLQTWYKRSTPNMLITLRVKSIKELEIVELVENLSKIRKPILGEWMECRMY